MAKVVINNRHGGFGLSEKAIKRYFEIKGWDLIKDKNNFSIWDLERDDPVLIQVVEELGSAADGDCAELRVFHIESGTRYIIEEYDGAESITLEHEIIWKTA